MSAVPVEKTRRTTAEGLVEIDGEGFYAVPDVDRMPPFLMSVVSDGDRWMFISSSGGLTAGRVDAAGALFPYQTDDRLHDAAGLVGPVTVIRVPSLDEAAWSPFRGRTHPPVHRCLYRSVVGNSIIFEELHPGLQLGFRYRWESSDRFGFVRTATLSNLGDRPVRVELVDGLVNLLPYGLDPTIYRGLSNLTNAYKRSEIIDPPARLAVYTLETRVADRPEPAEVLRATAVWSVGLEGASLTVSPDAPAGFEADGQPAGDVGLLTGRPGAYLLRGGVDLDPGAGASWLIVADVALDQVAVTDLQGLLHSAGDLRTAVTTSTARATEELVEIMARADALQRTGDRVATAHQFANVTYNVMRGGIPLAGYQIRRDDFAAFVRDRNRRVADRLHDPLHTLPEMVDRGELLERIRHTGDPHLVRLGLEYLPFSFSRRHGDPSRPWNEFSIRLRDGDGNPVVRYEGNWRDIFQNWEALSMSFPDYLTGMISVFVNSSTPDGFNPYRITREGIDWEVPDPDDPWSNIGYWGDHQIVYLHRLLEAASHYLPGEVERLIGEQLFTYADVPYRIAPYPDLVRDPKATIDYDEEAAARTAERVAGIGNDGKVRWTGEGEIYLVTLLEKLLVPALAKLSNFVPGGGIWMNTQRPEWNDANNALVGHGLSMVTLYQLRPYLDYLRTLAGTARPGEVMMTQEVAGWLTAVSSALHGAPARLDEIDDHRRKQILDDLGGAFSDYRIRIYRAGFSGVTQVTADAVVDLCDIAIDRLDETIRAARRTDGLYHSYNLIHFAPDGSSASVENLGEMLEGQVAVLGAGVLSSEEQAGVIDALYASAMYRADVGSFMLYPARRPPSFLDKNVVPVEDVERNPLLTALLAAGDRSVLTVDAGGRYRFNADFANRDDLDTALERLAGDDRWSALVASHRDDAFETYERVFRHHAYTGRSGSMYGYEGIGSVYWHMVAKLLVAVQEAAVEAETAGADPATVARLVDGYWRIRSGLGFNKTAREFGAIPTDPYSHTPAHAGAQQPGMTGLVKEELLTRPLELGVRVEDGEIRFDPLLLRRSELLGQPESWSVYDLDLEPWTVELGEGSLGMTVCQVPVVVSVTDGDPAVELMFADGSTVRRPGLAVDRPTSAAIFARSGEIRRITACLPSTAL